MSGLPLNYVTAKGWHHSPLPTPGTQLSVCMKPIYWKKMHLFLPTQPEPRDPDRCGKGRLDFILQSTLGYKPWCNIQLKPKVR